MKLDVRYANHPKDSKHYTTEELRKHDVMVDLSLNHSFGMTYIEAILNGKKVFCMKNPGSLEVMENIPNSYIESFEDLYEKLNHLYEIPKEELMENYKKIDKKYSRRVVTDKFIKFMEVKSLKNNIEKSP